MNRPLTPTERMIGHHAEGRPAKAQPRTPYDEEIAERQAADLSTVILQYEQAAYRRALDDLAPVLEAARRAALELRGLADQLNLTRNGYAHEQADSVLSKLAALDAQKEAT